MQRKDGQPQIYDVVRKKMVALTPEEWVRQHVVHYFLSSLGVPPGNLAVERGLVLNGTQKRFDVLAYKQGEPYVLVECKAPEVPINAEVLHQAWRYHQVIPARYVMLSNGLLHFMAEAHGNRLTPLPELPLFDQWT